MSAELGLWAIAFVAFVCLFSGFAHGAVGFGFPMVATPLVALVIDIKSAIALLAPITLVLTVLSALRGGPLMTIVREFWFVPVATALGAWLGTRVLIAAPPEPFVLILALVMLLYLNMDRLGYGRSPRVQRHRVAFGLGPAQIVQTLNLCFSVGKGAQTLTWAASGAMAPATWVAIGALVPPTVGALYAGMRVRERIDAETYRRWLRGALWVMALLLLGQFSTQLWASDDALFRAIEKDREQEAASLVRRGGVDLDARNAAGDTPLHRAVEKDMPLLARALLERGADVNARAKSGETPLHLAALHTEPALAQLLLAAGADANARTDEGESVLLWATLSGNVALVRLLRPLTGPASKKRR